MTAVEMHPLEKLLHLIAQAEPQAWYPRAYADTAKVSLSAVYHYLELLYLEGLVVKGEVLADKGPGVVLTLRGKRLLDDEEGLERLRQGKSLEPGDRGGMIREALSQPGRPIVTRLLLLANFLVFGFGLYLAWSKHLGAAYLSAFLRQDPGIQPVLHQIGSLTAFDLIQGQWWRLLSSAFVHVGLIHLLLNMYMLYVAGKYVEQMWGWLRYLVIYLLSAWGGSCLALAMQAAVVDRGRVLAIPMAGASAALCGLVGAEAVWMWLNRKYLPRNLVRRWFGGFVATALLLVFLSLFPGIGGWAHLGGALTGLLVGVLLHWLRFGPPLWRWLGLIALVPLPWAGYALIERERKANPLWHKLEAREFGLTYRRLVLRTMKEVDADFPLEKPTDKREGKKLRLIDQGWERRDPAKVEKALETSADLRKALGHLEKRLRQAGPYRNDAVEAARQKSLEYVQARQQQLELVERCLREKDRFSRKDEGLRQQQEKKVAALQEEWEDLFGEDDEGRPR